jgi:tricorn protease-like protein
MVLWLADLQSKKYFRVSDTGKSYQAEFTADSQYLAYQEVTDSTNNVGNLQLFNLNTDGNEQIATDVTSYVIESDSLVYTQANTSGSLTTTSLYSSPIKKLNSAQLLLGPENGILRFIQ